MTVKTWPATEKQVAFAQSLAEQVHGENAAEFMLAHREEGTFDDKQATSRLIDALLKLPKAGGKAEQVETPDPGYYCAEYQGVLRFYAVREGKGKWEGRTFLNRFKSDELGRVYRDEQTEVYAQILADPQAAQTKFAAETTHCYACGRRLTDAVSRELGIGPDCRGRR